MTSRQILDRLNKELVHNVALRVEETDDADALPAYPVVARAAPVGADQHMRREGFDWRFPVESYLPRNRWPQAGAIRRT